MDFKERLEKISQKNRKVKHTKNQIWPIEKRIEVVGQFLILGNMRLVSATTGVAYDLVRKWKGQPWWPELVAEIRATQNIEMDTKLSKIVEKSLEATLDRVEHGDFIYDQKSGEVRRKPAALRDIHRVSVDLLGKREQLREGAETRREDAQVTIKEHLKLLADEMAKWFEPKKKQEVIELEEIEDAIYEERETRLQTGTPVGTQEEAGESQGTSGTERSPEGNG